VAPRAGSHATHGLAALAIAASLIVALAPPVRSAVLAGPLNDARAILIDHGTTASLGDRLPASLSLMWAAWALALDGPVAAGLVHWAIGLLLALAAVLLARSLLDRSSAWLAGSFVFLCPGVQAQVGGEGALLAASLFATLALAAMARILVEGAERGWAIAAGLMLSATLIAGPTIALPALFVTTAVVVWLTARRWADISIGQRRREAAVFAVAVLLAAVLAVLTESAPAGIRAELPNSWASIGPLLVIVPGALWFARRLRGLSLIWWVVAPLATAGLLSYGAQDWWALAVGPLAAAAVWLWLEMARLPDGPRVVARVAICAAAVPGVAVACQLAAGSLAVAVGWQSRHDYLLARAPTYQAASRLNQIIGQGQRLFCQDPRALYFACSTARPVDLEPHVSPPTADASDDAWLAWAHAQGFTYLLLARPVEPASNGQVLSSRSSGATVLPAAPAAVPAAFGELLPILEYRFADDNNRPIRYSLLRVQSLASARRVGP
jgi:hypothetical protein